MRRWICSLAMTLIACVSAPAQSFDELLAERLNESVAYRQAALQLAVARQALDKISKVYIPYVNVGLSPASPGGYLYSNAGFSAVSVRPSVQFANVFGADIEIASPIAFGPLAAAEGTPAKWALGFGNPTIEVTRKLFEEIDVEQLNARAALMKAGDSKAAAFADERIALVSDIFNAYISLRSLEDAQKRIEVAEALKATSQDPSETRDLERSLLQAKRTVLQTERTLRAIDKRVVENAAELYAEVDSRFDGWIADLPAADAIPESTRALAANELDLAAAEAKRSRSFLPYVPNPAFSAALGFDTRTQKLYWGFSIQLSVPIVDRGERAIAVLQRRETADIERLRLDAARKALETSVQNAWDDLELLDIDLRIAELDLANQREATARTHMLYDGGFATETTLLSAELSLSASQLQVEDKSNEYRLGQLKLVRYFAETE